MSFSCNLLYRYRTVCMYHISLTNNSGLDEWTPLSPPWPPCRPARRLKWPSTGSPAASTTAIFAVSCWTISQAHSSVYYCHLCGELLNCSPAASTAGSSAVSCWIIAQQRLLLPSLRWVVELPYCPAGSTAASSAVSCWTGPTPNSVYNCHLWVELLN